MKTALSLAAVFLAGLVGIVLIAKLRPTPAAADPHQPPVEMVIPEFSAVDRDGQPVDQSLLDGHYTVVDFFYTSCPLYCPGMTAAMKTVQSQIASPDLRLFSLSIDGDNDTPEVIGRYADQFGTDASRWTFATAPPKAVWPVVKSLGFLVEFDPNTPVNRPSGQSQPTINHPTRLMLVGPDRRVIGMYRYTDPADIDSLVERLNTLLK